jgi:hypothetical protein
MVQSVQRPDTDYGLDGRDSISIREKDFTLLQSAPSASEAHKPPI